MGWTATGAAERIRFRFARIAEFHQYVAYAKPNWTYGQADRAVIWLTRKFR